jgi:hypothetical protein
MAFGTPSKSRVSTVGNEENQENMIKSCEQQLSTPSKRDSGIEAPTTVSARREWLSQFGKKSVDHYQSGSNNNGATSESRKSSTVETSASKGKTPMTSTLQTSASKGKTSMTSTLQTSASKGKTPMTSTITTASSQINTAEPVKRNFTPRKKKPVKHSGVEATDDGVASVRKLSQWLSSDPTTKKKVVNVPRGRQVSYKSRNFERGQENVIVRENHIQRGSVTDKKNWLKKAFHAQEEEAEQVDELTSRLNRQYAKSEVGVYDPSATRYAQSEIVTSRPSNMSVSLKKDWLKKAFKSAADASREEKKQEEEPRSVIITDDAASNLSVSDKKKWIQGAFKKTEGTGTPAKKSGASQRYAASDIVHCRGESRDEIAARAKRKFLQRSASGRLGTPSKSTPVKTKTTPVKHTPTKKKTGFEPNVLGSQSEGRVDINPKMEAPKLDTTMNSSENFGSIVEPKRMIAVEEDKTPVDFRAARDLLVQRGRQNDNRIEVQRKLLQDKKTKYEEMDKERKRAADSIAMTPFDEMQCDSP